MSYVLNSISVYRGVDYNTFNGHPTLRVLARKELKRSAFCWMETGKKKTKAKTKSFNHGRLVKINSSFIQHVI